MIPIRLNWQRRPEGFELKIFERSDGSKVKIAEPRSERADPVHYEAINLEDPIVLHLINCQTDIDYVGFLDRFGTLEAREISKSDEFIGDIEYTLGSFEKPRSSGYRRQTLDLSNLPVVREPEPKSVILNVLKDRAFSLEAHVKVTLLTRIDAKSRVHYLNELMDRAGVIVQPSFVHSAGATRFVLEADTLFDFLIMEIAAIHAAGAVATSCEHCRKIFLTGPLTGRRSHAKYCSDRCRVAAMRARNASKED